MTIPIVGPMIDLMSPEAYAFPERFFSLSWKDFGEFCNLAKILFILQIIEIIVAILFGISFVLVCCPQ